MVPCCVLERGTFTPQSTGRCALTGLKLLTLKHVKLNTNKYFIAIAKKIVAVSLCPLTSVLSKLTAHQLALYRTGRDVTSLDWDDFGEMAVPITDNWSFMRYVFGNSFNLEASDSVQTSVE